jgi:hypothetical protein
MAFGKRTGFLQPGPAPVTTPQNPHGQRKAIPEEIWNGEHGAFLRELGMSPDDAANLVPNANSLNARIKRDRAAFEEKLARYNLDIGRRTNGGAVKGFSLLPDPCWNGEFGQLLMARLDLFPYDEWNMAILPCDMETAQALNAPPHPGQNIPAFVENSRRFMLDAEKALRDAVAECDRTQNFAKFNEAREEIRTAVKRLATNYYATMVDLWEQNRPQTH